MLKPHQVMGQFSKHSHVNTQYRSNQVLSFIKHPWSMIFIYYLQYYEEIFLCTQSYIDI